MLGASAAIQYDPLQYFATFPFEASFYPLGFPVIISSTDPRVLETAEQAWGSFRKGDRHANRRLEVKVLVSGDGPLLESDPPTFRAHGRWMTVVGGAANHAVIDLRDGTAMAWVTGSTVAARERFSYHFLEAMVYALLTEAYLTPLHCAAVARNNQCLLLCGGTGAGKSTLAFACALDGWTFISDDACWLVRGDETRLIVGCPHRIRLRESAADLFDVLEARPVSTPPNGKRSIEVTPSEFPEIRTAGEACVDAVLFLDRQESGEPSLSPVDTSSALLRLEEGLSSFGEDWMRERRSSLERLLGAPAYRFRFSQLRAAVSALNEFTGHTRP